MKARIPGAQQNSQANMMKKIQEMQANMEAVQKEIEETVFSSSTGGGIVEAKVNGAHQVVEININPEAVDPDDVEMLQDLIISAVNESIRKANEAMESGMEKAKGGLSIPGLF
ncbi:MAG: YbaB/EbfC family nucleoid-associated protein [Clostridiales bacterium]|nr:YbaB/EbfC family nucleoid-associated protein [Clostridiales bacterium]